MNLAHIIDDHASDSPALISRGRTTSYGELREQVDRFRGGLQSIGVESGDRVAMLLSNSPHFVIAYLATVGLGAVAVPLNPTSPGPELETELGVVGARVVIVDKVSSTNWSHVDPALLPTVESVIHTEATPDGALGFDDLVASSEPIPVVEVDPSHLAALMFTSGTAGAPRAAMLSHRNLWANLDQSLSADGHIDADDVIFGVLPLFHIFGLNVVVGLGLRVGATLVLVQRFDPSTAVQSIQDRRITVIPGAPALWLSLIHI